MVACVKELLGLESLQNAELVASRKGSYRTISWPNVAQTASIREWLVGGDVIIVTGIGLDRTVEALQSILSQALEAHSACLLVYLSDMYIRDIPDEVLTMANESKFPIFTTPWDTLIANVIRDISQLLLVERYQSESMNSLIKELVFRSDTVPSELLLAFIKQRHLTTDHVVAVAEWLDDQEFGERFQQGVFIRQEDTNLPDPGTFRHFFSGLICGSSAVYIFYYSYAEGSDGRADGPLYKAVRESQLATHSLPCADGNRAGLR